MQPHLSVLTLGVDDLEASLRFYRDGLGLPTDGIIGQDIEGGAVVFIPLQGGLTLALYPCDSIARDTGLPRAQPSPTDLTLGHNVPSRADVDAIIALARAAGAIMVDEPRDRAWGGYSGHFQDLDGHLWEIVYNPNFPAS